MAKYVFDSNIFINLQRRQPLDVFPSLWVKIGELMDDEGQRLAYVFDPEAKRFFLMELTENLFGPPEPKPRVSRRHGKAPLQSVQDEDEAAPAANAAGAESGESFYGEDGFEDEELDLEGFEISE